MGPIIPIAFSANDETDPAIAYNPDRDEYLAIWDDNTLNAVRGVMLNPDGTIKGEPFFVIPPAPGEGDIHGMTLLYHPGVQRMFAFGIREEPGGSRAIGVIESAARDWGAVLNLTNLGVYVSAYAVARLTDNNLQFLVACTFAGVTNLFRSTLGPTLMPIGSPLQTTFFSNPPGVGGFSAHAVPSGTLLGVVGPNEIFGGLIGGILVNFGPFLSTPVRLALACFLAGACAWVSSDIDGRVYYQGSDSEGAPNGPNRMLLGPGSSDPNHPPRVFPYYGVDQFYGAYLSPQGSVWGFVVNNGELSGPPNAVIQQPLRVNTLAANVGNGQLALLGGILGNRREEERDLIFRLADLNGTSSDPTMLVSMNRAAYAPSDSVDLMITYGRGSSPANADAYLLLQLPDGSFLFGPDLSPAPKKHRNNFAVQDEIDPLRVKGLPIAGLAPGTYTWYWGLTRPGTLELIGGIGTFSFTLAAR